MQQKDNIRARLRHKKRVALRKGFKRLKSRARIIHDTKHFGELP